MHLLGSVYTVTAFLEGVCNDVGMKTDPPLEAHSEQH